MPYKFETQKKVIPKQPQTDRRIKLTEQQKDEIRATIGMSQRELAALYGVSRRTIQFVKNPDSLAENIARRNERGGSMKYYDKEKHRQYMKKHRNHKSELNKNGLLK